MKKNFHLSRLLYVVTTILCIHTAQAQLRPEKHEKKSPVSQQPTFVKGVVLIKFNKFYENALAVKSDNRPVFGIGKLDSILSKLKPQKATQEFAILFNKCFNEQSARNIARQNAKAKKSVTTADILEQRHKEFGFHLWYRLQFDTSVYLKAVLDDLQSLEGIVDVAELVPVLDAQGFKGSSYSQEQSLKNSGRGTGTSGFNDPLYPQQTNLHNTGQGTGIPGKDIDIERAWNITTGDSNVVVAVTEGGVYLNHEDLQGSMWWGKGYNFFDDTTQLVPAGHATASASVIAARSNNGIGMSGIAGGDGTSASGARIMSCDVFGSGFGLNYTPGYVYAADNGAAINNYSFFWYYTSFYHPELTFLDALRYFNKYGGGEGTRGGVTVFAGGNENIPFQPASSSYDVDSKLVVASVNNSDRRAAYSNYGDWIDICAPGGEPSTNPANTFPVAIFDVTPTDTVSTYSFAGGTSMAAPVVSGVAALVASVAPGRFTADEVTCILLNTADNIDSLNPGYEGKLGAGRVNAYKAVLKAQQMAAQPLLDTVSRISVIRNCAGYTVSYTKNAANNDVMIAMGLSRKFDLPNGHVYHVGDSIGKNARIVYRGSASSFTSNFILKDSAMHYIKIWSVNGSNYSGGMIYRADSSYHTLRNPSAIQGANEVDISFGKACPNSDVLVVANSLPQFGIPVGTLNAGDAIAGGGTVLYKGSAAGYPHTGLTSGSYYYALYPVINNVYGQAKYLGGYCFGVTGTSLPLKTSFETPGVPQNFALFTLSQDEFGWKITNNVTANTGTGAAYTNNRYNYHPNTFGEPSYLQTAALNITGGDSVICKFAYVYSGYDTSYGYAYLANYSDTLSVLISTDCGQSWKTVWQKWGINLSTTSPNFNFGSAGEPGSSDYWKTIKINLTGFIPAGTESMMVAFKNSNRGAKNIYLDDINIYKVVHTDAGIAAVINPHIEACATTFSPKIVLENFGLNPLTAVTIHYQFDNNAIQTFNWTGIKGYEQTDTLMLPSILTTAGNHHLTVFTSDPNILADGVPANDSTSIDFNVIPTLSVAQNVTHKESFEDPLSLPNGWRVADPQNAYTWVRVDKHSPFLEDFHAEDDSSAMLVPTASDPIIGAVHDLYTPPFSTGNADTVLLTFSRAAFAYYVPGNTTDKLDVLLTMDCGETFTNIYSKTGTDLATSSTMDQYQPLSAADWKSDTVDVSNLVRNISNYRFIFRVTNGNENFVFLDNVQLHSNQMGALPIKLISFMGYRKSAANELQWKASITSATMFTVQRSTNGRDFENLSAVNAPAGTTEKTFSLTDNNLHASKYYYRLQMKETDGQITYSNIIVLISNKDGIEINGFYPSPLKGNTGYLNISSGKSQKLQVVVSDIAGKKISTQAINVIAGSNNISVTFGKLAVGTYLLRVVDEKNGSNTIRFLKD